MARQYKQSLSREQGELFPSHMDDFVSENHSVRVIDAYIESLDLRALGYQNTEENKNLSGQPAYPPSALLKLYIYGYLNRIKSSRSLEKECHRNIEVIWLMKGLKPVYKTIANFRSQNRVAIRSTHKDFILFCNKLSLFGGSCVAVDGSFFKGSASRKSFTTTAGLKKSLKQLDIHITQWQKELDQQDAQEKEGEKKPRDIDLEKALQQLEDWKKEKEDKESELERLEKSKKTQESSTDKDARLLNKKSQKVSGYNVQIAVDSKHHLIVCDEVTTEPNDLKQLHPMSLKAKKILNSDELEVLADAGYYSGAHIAKCVKDKITPYAPKPKTGGKGKKERYTKDQFIYDAGGNHYVCPAGEALNQRGSPRTQNGQVFHRFSASETVCKSCPQKANCLGDKIPCRVVWRSENADLLTAHQERMKTSKGKMRERSALVEHPFGTMKSRAGWSHFLLRGQEKVAAEFSLMALCYNFTRALNILGFGRLLEEIKNKALFRLKRRGSELYLETYKFYLFLQMAIIKDAVMTSDSLRVRLEGKEILAC